MSVVKFLFVSIAVNAALVLGAIASLGGVGEMLTPLLIFGPVILTWAEMKTLIWVYNLLTKKK